MMQATTVNYEPAGGDSTFYDDHPHEGLMQNNNAPFDQQQQTQQHPSNKHPVAVVFHLLFKIAAITTYLVGFFAFPDNFIVVFIVITMLIAFDFWTVKNVTGRLLAGLRWWNEIKEDGSNLWIFESLPQQERDALDSRESMVFWISLFVTPAVWVLFLLGCLLPPKPSYIVIVLVALALNSANVVGYMKCRKDAKKKLEGAATKFVVGQMINRATNAV